MKWPFSFAPHLLLHHKRDTYVTTQTPTVTPAPALSGFLPCFYRVFCLLAELPSADSALQCLLCAWDIRNLRAPRPPKTYDLRPCRRPMSWRQKTPTNWSQFALGAAQLSLRLHARFLRRKHIGWGRRKPQTGSPTSWQLHIFKGQLRTNKVVTAYNNQQTTHNTSAAITTTTTTATTT